MDVPATAHKPKGTVKRFAKAVVKHAATGFKKTPDDVFEMRQKNVQSANITTGRPATNAGVKLWAGLIN